MRSALLICYTALALVSKGQAYVVHRPMASSSSLLRGIKQNDSNSSDVPLAMYSIDAIHLELALAEAETTLFGTGKLLLSNDLDKATHATTLVRQLCVEDNPKKISLHNVCRALSLSRALEPGFQCDAMVSHSGQSASNAPMRRNYFTLMKESMRALVSSCLISQVEVWDREVLRFSLLENNSCAEGWNYWSPYVRDAVSLKTGQLGEGSAWSVISSSLDAVDGPRTNWKIRRDAQIFAMKTFPSLIVPEVLVGFTDIHNRAQLWDFIEELRIAGRLVEACELVIRIINLLLCKKSVALVLSIETLDLLLLSCEKVLRGINTEKYYDANLLMSCHKRLLRVLSLYFSMIFVEEMN